ncbi:hypothetical protein [Klebsiella pneumoniae]|uniref:hypothetical protein n=1 Tax=Klebsiella pneumoniae TaxID=573 RepID=UPI003BF7704B
MRNKLTMSVFDLLDLMGKIGKAKATNQNEEEFIDSLNDAEILTIIDNVERFNPEEIKRYTLDILIKNPDLIMRRINEMNIPD